MSEWNDKFKSIKDYGRKECPMCYASGKDLKEMEDYGKPLYFFGNYKKMYAKVNVCKKCGYRWN